MRLLCVSCRRRLRNRGSRIGSILVNPLLHDHVVYRLNLAQHIGPMRGIMFNVEPHAWHWAKDLLHHIHLGGGKSPAFKDGAIAQENARIDVMNPIVLRPCNRGGSIIVAVR